MALHFPLLTRLELDSWITRPECILFTLNDFETIHWHLEHLEHLSLNFNVSSLSATDLGSRSKIGPASKMKSFKLKSKKKITRRWLYYFTHKYPGLHTFELNSNDYKTENEQHDADMTLLQPADLPFQQLRKLDVRYADCTREEYIFFWDAVQPYKPLKHVSIFIDDILLYQHIHEPDALEHIPELFMNKCPKTIEYLLIRTPKTYARTLDMIDIKDTLYNLVKLELLDSILSIEIDSLLEASPRLKTLCLRSTHVQVKDELYDPNIFGLQSLDIDKSTITSDSLRFLSFHCRNLETLSLVDSEVSGKFLNPGCQLIDMTYTRLSTLNIIRTAFIVKGTKEFPENFNIAVITRPVDDTLNFYGYSRAKAHYHWFYKGYVYGEDPWKDSVVKSGIFISDYKDNKIAAIYEAASFGSVNMSNDWINHYVFGYTKIKFGYIAECNIESFYHCITD